MTESALLASGTADQLSELPDMEKLPTVVEDGASRAVPSLL